jgi:Flp pilus assembly protein TadG
MKRAFQVIEREEGSDLVEFSLVVIPMFMFVFAIMCVAWFIFAKATLQHAVREGCRYAVTGQSATDIQQRVVSDAIGVPNLSPDQVSVTYYSQTDLTTPVTGTSANAGGNVVEVSVGLIPGQPVSIAPLGPVGLGFAAVTLSASASDVMEAH